MYHLGNNPIWLKLWGGKVKDYSYRYFGLNHLGWFTHMYDANGVDQLPELSKYVEKKWYVYRKCYR